MKKTSEKGPGKSGINKTSSSAKAFSAYGDKTPICANTGCALRKKAKCSGFEGCPGFKTK